jgi:DNA-binding response OmpR family regulator
MATVLLIDDEYPVRDTCRAALEAAGHTVVEAENGKFGDALCRAVPPDLVITDLMMPEKEGIETIIGLRRDFPQLKIIAMSGALYSGAFLAAAAKLGASCTLHKPFTSEQLLAAVNQVLSA